MAGFTIKTSEDNRQLVTKYSRKVFGNGVSENNIARVAIACSLASSIKLDPETHYQDNKGKEYKDHTLFGEHEKYYIAFVCQRYKLYRTDRDIPKYIKMHLDHGLEYIHDYFMTNPSASGFDFLKEVVQTGMYALQNYSYADAEPNQQSYKQNEWEKQAFNERLNISVGTSTQQGNEHSEIIDQPNFAELHDNLHISIAGQSGVGKSHFVFKLLRRIHENSNGRINFLFLDYKGEQPGREFLDATNCEVVDFVNSKVPFNPLALIDRVNETNKNYGISAFTDIIKDFANLGNVQSQTLKRAIASAFEQIEKGNYPDFALVLKCVYDENEGRLDSLTNVLSQLADNNIFSSNSNFQDFFDRNYYFKLEIQMPNDVKITSIFIVIYFVYNVLMRLPAVPIEQGVQPVRYYLVIDEAHALFSSKKSKQLLDKILRTIRSKGVGVMLISQTVEEFLDRDFMLSSQCDTGFLFRIKAMDLSKVRRFLGLPENVEPQLKKSLEALDKYQVVSNLKSYEPGKRIQL